MLYAGILTYLRFDYQYVSAADILQRMLLFLWSAIISYN